MYNEKSFSWKTPNGKALRLPLIASKKGKLAQEMQERKKRRKEGKVSHIQRHFFCFVIWALERRKCKEKCREILFFSSLYLPSQQEPPPRSGWNFDCAREPNTNFPPPSSPPVVKRASKESVENNNNCGGKKIHNKYPFKEAVIFFLFILFNVFTLTRVRLVEKRRGMENWKIEKLSPRWNL